MVKTSRRHQLISERYLFAVFIAILLLCSISHQSRAQSFDNPNLEYEAQLHDIYVNFHSNKTSQEQWQGLLGDRQSENYAIQKGDSLWNISQTFFNDGNYWPKIWSINSSITNPHLIRKGNTIQFMMGTESDAPAFTVTEGAGADTTLAPGPQLAQNDSSESDSTESAEPAEPDVELPPPLNESRPVLRRLPPSIPQWQERTTSGVYDELGMEFGPRKILSPKQSLFLPTYVSEDEPEDIGNVVEMEGPQRTAATYQTVYVRLDKGRGKTGDKYVVVRDGGRVQRVESSGISGRRGRLIQIEGEIQLQDVVQGLRSTSSYDYFKAIVTNALHSVEIDSLLIEGELRPIDVSMRGPRSNVVAQVTGGQYDPERHLLGTGNFIFLNRGSEDGLEVGHVLPVRAFRELRNPKTIIGETLAPIAWVKIVHVTNEMATAIIVQAYDSVQPGDLTGQGSLLDRGEKKADAIDDTPEQEEPAQGDESTQGSSDEEEIEEATDEISDEVTDDLEPATDDSTTDDFSDELDEDEGATEPENIDRD